MVSPAFQPSLHSAASGLDVLSVEDPRFNGENAEVPQRPSVASAVLSWTWTLRFSTVLLSLRVTTTDIRVVDVTLLFK